MKLNKNIIKIILLVIFFLIILLNFQKILSYYDNARTFIESSGFYGPLIYGLLMIIAILIAPIPASPLVILAGSLFGPWLGMLYTLIFATLGAIIAFLIARFLLRNSLSRYYEGHHWYKKIEGRNDINIAYLVFLTRLMPQVSFDVVSYLAGLTKLRASWFAIATFLGMIPIVFLLSFLGSAIEPYLNIILTALLIIFVLYVIYLITKEKWQKQ